ncbi:peptidoglycan/LPS O-acetylase OafA/YrhL [Alteromonas sp. 76-1]|uniref:acyltransferase family protein n=1 Tax=Alteromonas sp. 76-1 TaxID=2358187 RepID=UPI000FD17AA6|nr:acyltransferase family protein [Alteromonas sp. 76-1]VEL96568.1 peptidoglycan/LPS O-acetylase OafA/YrhL [Alteromonas sp. 76-1]
MKFREDINALRAIAVVSVVLFHFNHDWLPGGFAGVDVFFVISGFLMTMIIVKGLEKETFSILSFYKARVRRIIPALAVLCFVLMFLGLFLLSPIDYLNLGKHSAASLTFLSNMVYWTESNYFNPSSNEKWLLHTWSLSVEWQFYLIYPIALVILRKFLTLNQLTLMLVAGTILAFILSVLVTMKSSSAAYFLLPTRAWQMLAGGLVFLYPIQLKDSVKSPLQLLGLLLIVSSFFIYTSTTPWPGYASLLPIIGACIVLVSNNGESKLVNNSVTHALGKWSYSIYLWHWPIVVAGYYFELGENWWAIGIPLSLILGALSFKFIESKTLSDYRVKNLKYVLRPLPFAFISTLVGLSILYTNGFLFRLPPSEQLLVKSAIEAKDDWNYPKPNMEIGSLDIRFIKGRSDKNILVMGASHIEQIYPYVDSLDNEYNIYFLTQAGCFVTPSMKNPKWKCSNLQMYSELLERVKFDKIVTSFYSFNSYLSKEPLEREQQILIRIKEFDSFLVDMKEKTPQIYILLGEPRGDEFDPVLALRRSLPGSITELKAREEYLEHVNAFARLTALDGVKVIDPILHLCTEGTCPTRNKEDGFFYRDKNHMRPLYAINNLGYLYAVFVENDS